MTFAEPNRMTYRHASDFYSTLDGAGNFIARHPSGTYIGIGTTPELPDLTGADYDGAWKLANNTQSKAYIHLAVANADAGTVTALSIAPDGAVKMSTTGTMDLAIKGALTTAAASWAHKGPFSLDGAMTCTRDGVFAGVSVDHHLHQDTQPGDGNSGPPVMGTPGGGSGGGSGGGIVAGDGAAAAAGW